MDVTESGKARSRDAELRTDRPAPGISGSPREEKTILLVDDEIGVLKACSQYLSRQGYRILTSKNGEDAIRQYQKQTVDLVLLDLILPGMSGLDCLKAMKNINQQVKVIMSSGYSMIVDEKRFLDKGVSAFITKPYALGELLKAVQKTLVEPPS